MISKQIYLFLLLLSIIVFETKMSAQALSNTNDFSQFQIHLVSDYLLQFPDDSQLSIALTVGDKVSYIGVRKTKNEIFLIDNKDSVFEIGSITKVFTSTILSRLVIDSIINLDGSIEGILPYNLKQISMDDIPLTFKSLANHTSGLAFEPSNINLSIEKDPTNPYMAYDYSLLDDYLKKSMELNTVSGTTYRYSNLGFGLLGYLMEIKSGKSYEALLQNLVFDRYDLQNSSTEYNKVKKLIVAGLDTIGQALPHWECNALRASGGVLSNANDLSKFLLANFQEDAVLDLQHQITYSKMNKHVALGWEVFEVGGAKCALDWYFKTGGMGGYSSVVLMDIRAHFGVVILSNISAYHKNANTLQLGIELLKDLYLVKDDKLNYCEAPFLEMALQKGWGTWNKSVNESILEVANNKNPLVGIWQRPSNMRSQIGIDYEIITFMPDGKVQADFMGNPEIDVWGYYYTIGNKVEFEDLGGNACKYNGQYIYSVNNDTLFFQLLEDPCEERLKILSGKWTLKK